MLRDSLKSLLHCSFLRKRCCPCQYSSNNSRWKWILLVTSVVFFLSSFSFFVIYGLFFQCPKQYEVCRTGECVVAGSEILQKLNEAASPCQDFYQFACGNYLQDAPIPGDEEEWSTIRSTADAMLFVLQKFLSEDPPENNTDATSKAKIFYNSCMKENRVKDEASIAAVHLTLTEAGVEEWPILDPYWNRNDIDLEKRLAVLIVHRAMPFFDMRVVHNATKQHPIILKVTTGKPVLETEYYLSFERDYPLQLQVYREFMSETLRHLGVAEDRARRDINDMIAFETHFANLTKLHRDRIEKERENETEREIEGQGERFNMSQLNSTKPEVDRTKVEKANKTERVPEGGVYNISDLDEMMPEIDWTLLVKYICNNLNASRCELHQVYLDSVLSMTDLLRLLENTPRRTLANYMMWRFLYRYMYALHGSFRRLYYDFIEKHLNVSSRYIPMWRECSEVVHHGMSMVTTSLYIRHEMNVKKTIEIHNMVTSLKKRFMDLVKTQRALHWDKRYHCMQKIKNMEVAIGYTKVIFDSKVLNDFYKRLDVRNDHFVRNFLRYNKFVFFKNIEPVLYPKVTRDKNDTADNKTVSLLKSTTVQQKKVNTTLQQSKVNTTLQQRKVNTTVQQSKVNITERNLSIVLPLEILLQPFFSPEQKRYQNYGMLGTFIGYEIMRQLTKQGDSMFKLSKKGDWPNKTGYHDMERLECFEKNFLLRSAGYPNQKSKIPANILNSMRNERIGIEQSYLAYQKHSKSEPRLPGLEYSNEQMFFIMYGQMMCEASRNKDSSFQGYDKTSRNRVNNVVRSEHFNKVFDCRDSALKRPSIYRN